MPIYMQIDGIKGSVTETKHKDWIQLNSFQWGVGRAISSPVGNTSDRRILRPVLERNLRHEGIGHRLGRSFSYVTWRCGR